MNGPVACGAVSLFAETFGNGDDTVVFIAGLGAHLTDWHDDLIATVVDAGFRVIRFDNRDAGYSTHLADLPAPSVMDVLNGVATAPYSLDDMAADVASLIENVSPSRTFVVGQSLGGMVAQCLAIRRPELVAGMVLVSTTTGARDVGMPSAETIARLMAPAGTVETEEFDPVEAGIRSSTPRTSWELGVTEAELRERMQKRADRGVDRLGTRRQYAAAVAAPDRTEALRRMCLPVVVMHGRDDPLIGVSGGEALASAIPDATLTIVDGWRHDLPRVLWPQIVGALEELRTRA